jgi:isochorismate hydrolase
MIRCVKKEKKTCENCLKANKQRLLMQFRSGPILAALEEWEIDHLLICGTEKSSRYLINARCTESGSVEALIVNDTVADFVIQIFREELIARHGTPKVIHTDMFLLVAKR